MSQSEDKKSKIMEYFRENGYKAELDTDGDVKFKREGEWYVIRIEDELYQLFIQFSDELKEMKTENPNLSDIKCITDDLIALMFTNTENRIVKVFRDVDTLTFTVNSFYSNVDEFLGHFEKICRSIREAIKKYAACKEYIKQQRVS